MRSLIIYLLLVLGVLAYYGVSHSEDAQEILRLLRHRIACALLRTRGRFVAVALGTLVLVLLVGAAVRQGQHRHSGFSLRRPAVLRVSAVALPSPSTKLSTPPVGSSAQPETAPSRVGPTSTFPVRTVSRPPTRPAGHWTPPSVAVSFVRQWVRSTVPVATWRTGLAPYVTTGFGRELALTDPRNVPATRVTGSPKIGATADGQVQVTVPTDTYPVVVTEIWQGGRWRVDSAVVNW